MGKFLSSSVSDVTSSRSQMFHVCESEYKRRRNRHIIETQCRNCRNCHIKDSCDKMVNVQTFSSQTLKSSSFSAGFDSNLHHQRKTEDDKGYLYSQTSQLETQKSSLETFIEKHVEVVQ